MNVRDATFYESKRCVRVIFDEKCEGAPLVEDLVRQLSLTYSGDFSRLYFPSGRKGSRGIPFSNHYMIETKRGDHERGNDLALRVNLAELWADILPIRFQLQRSSWWDLIRDPQKADARNCSHFLENYARRLHELYVNRSV